MTIEADGAVPTELGEVVQARSLTSRLADESTVQASTNDAQSILAGRADTVVTCAADPAIEVTAAKTFVAPDFRKERVLTPIVELSTDRHELPEMHLVGPTAMGSSSLARTAFGASRLTREVCANAVHSVALPSQTKPQIRECEPMVLG